MNENQVAWDMFAGHEGGTEADMIEAGYAFGALKGDDLPVAAGRGGRRALPHSDLAAAMTGMSLRVDAATS